MVDGLNFTALLETIESNLYFQQVTSLVSRTYLELFFFTLGLFVYAFFVWQFYKRLAKRDLFTLELDQYDLLPDSDMKTLKKAGSSLAYILKYLILFPLYVAFWFAVLSLFLFILAKEVAVRQIILMSTALISTIRMASYYKEELASDLAKLLPFVFLALFLTEPSFFSLDILYNRFQQLPTLTSVVIEFFTFTIVFEWILRLGYGIKRLFYYEEKEEKET